jgi:hypothetical protein
MLQTYRSRSKPFSALSPPLSFIGVDDFRCRLALHPPIRCLAAPLCGRGKLLLDLRLFSTYPLLMRSKAHICSSDRLLRSRTSTPSPYGSRRRWFYIDQGNAESLCTCLAYRKILLFFLICRDGCRSRRARWGKAEALGTFLELNRLVGCPESFRTSL